MLSLLFSGGLLNLFSSQTTPCYFYAEALREPVGTNLFIHKGNISYILSLHS